MGRASYTARAEDTAALRPDWLYPYRAFIRDSGIGPSRIGDARRNGVELRSLKVGRRVFIKGTDGIEFIERLAELEQAQPVATYQ